METVKTDMSPNAIHNWRRFGGVALLGFGLALLTLAGTSEGPAAAESAPRFTGIAISVMPEYDQPRVLVSYRGELNADVSLPLQVRIRLPGDATIEHACSLKPPDDEHICHEYATEPDGDYQTLSYKATTNVIYVEYHYGSVSGAGQRALDFAFWPPYPVANLDLFVQEPSQAADFTLSPAPATSLDERGFRHHTYTFQDLSTDKPVSIQMTYSRPTDQPSAPPQDAASAAAPTTGESKGIPQAAILLLSLAGAAVLGFVVYAGLARRFRLRLVASPAQGLMDGSGMPPADTFFCRHCGHTVKAGFTFCPKCGQAVRLPSRE